MKCTGCKHCKIIRFHLGKRYLHYCDSRKFYTDEDDTIGDSYKFCEGKYYEYTTKEEEK